MCIEIFLFVISSISNSLIHLISNPSFMIPVNLFHDMGFLGMGLFILNLMEIQSFYYKSFGSKSLNFV